MKWNEFVNVHGPNVYRTAWRILGHVQDCEDVVQDVFIEAHRLFSKNEVTHWATFLNRLTTFRAIDALRRRKSVEPIDQEPIEDGGSTPEQVMVGTELETQIRQIIASLPERQAAVFCLVHFEQQQHAKVAEILNVTENAVSVALHKARRTLHEQLSREMEGPQS